MQVALYARVSTLTQQKEATIDSQLRRLKEQVKKQRWSLIAEQIYVDDGISGARLDRPALDRLRDAAKRGEFDKVVILSPDRLARNYAHQWLLIEELEKSGVQTIFLENPFGDSPEARLLVQMQGMIAEYERAAIVERTRRGRLEKARRGGFQPWAYNCYGYRYLPKRTGLPPQVVIDEQKATVVKQIYGWLIEQQLSLRQITRRLNELKIPTQTGKNRYWLVSTVASILNNPAYMGEARAIYRSAVIANKHSKEESKLKSLKSSKVTRPPEEWILVESPAIISKEVFQKAQLQLQRNREESRRMYRPKSKRYLLRSKVKCGLCGLAMTCRCHRSDKQPYLYYQCVGKDKVIYGREKKCSSYSVRAEKLDSLVWQALVGLLEKPTMITRLHKEWSKSKLSDIEQCQAQREALLNRRKRLEGQIQKLVDAYQEDVITLTELKSRRKKLQADIDRIAAEVVQLSQQQHKLVKWKELVANIEQFTNLLGKNLSDLSFQECQLVVQALIEKVVVTGGDVDIYYVLPFEEPPLLLTNATTAQKEGVGNFCRLCLADRNPV